MTFLKWRLRSRSRSSDAFIMSSDANPAQKSAAWSQSFESDAASETLLPVRLLDRESYDPNISFSIAALFGCSLSKILSTPSQLGY